MKILITSLGTSKYKKVTYSSDGFSHSTEFFSVALAKKIKPAKVLVMLTSEAKVENGESLFKELKEESIEFEEVLIASGKNEEELWKIFDAVVSSIPNEPCEVVLDVTHAFRSQGLVLFVCLSYLRVVKKASLEGVYYGAFEASNNEGIAPIFDLTPFISLLDWSYAGKVLDEQGDSSMIGKLMQSLQNAVWRSNATGDKPRELKSLGSALIDLSLALDLVRPDEIMEISSRLARELKEASAEVPRWAKPFSELLDDFEELSSKFALEKIPEDKETQSVLSKQLAISAWYCQHKRYLAASLIQRELIVSWFMFQLGCSQQAIDDDDMRKPYEARLHQLKDKSEASEYAFLSKTKINLSGLWDSVTQTRNDIAHVGMRKSPSPADSLKKKIIEIQASLQKLFEDTMQV
jgi:CRISPR-associated DxTHG motif protein